MTYQRLIRETLARLSRADLDPRHVEAFMRDEYGALGHLGGNCWNRAVSDAADLVERGGPKLAEDLAQALGLAAEAR
jgi:hypothetical protein